LKDITVAIIGGQSRVCELRIAPGARPRDILTAIGTRGLVAAASRPAPFDPDDDIYEALSTGAHLIVRAPTDGTEADDGASGGRTAARTRGGARHGQ
jgi:hypothetical protein